jgi:hypothetical protein
MTKFLLPRKTKLWMMVTEIRYMFSEKYETQNHIFVQNPIYIVVL